MEEKSRSTTLNGIYFGLATGAGLIVLSLILFLTDLYMNRWLSAIGYLMLIAGMVYGTLEYRKNYLNGFMSYGKAFSVLFKIGMFAGLVAAIYMFVFAQFIHPGFVQEILEKSREQMLSQNPNMTEEQLEMGLSWAAKFTSPVMMMVMGFLTYLLISAVIGLIAAIFLKKEDTSLNTTM
jgi:hypothetical protein